MAEPPKTRGGSQRRGACTDHAGWAAWLAWKQPRRVFFFERFSPGVSRSRRQRARALDLRPAPLPRPRSPRRAIRPAAATVSPGSPPSHHHCRSLPWVRALGRTHDPTDEEASIALVAGLSVRPDMGERLGVKSSLGSGCRRCVRTRGGRIPYFVSRAYVGVETSNILWNLGLSRHDRDDNGRTSCYAGASVPGRGSGTPPIRRRP
jgi:hypothetical protein